MAAAGGAGGAGGDDTRDGDDNSLWSGDELKEAAERVKKRIPKTEQGRKLVKGINALLRNDDMHVNLSSCRIGSVKEAKRLVASALAVNTKARIVEYVPALAHASHDCAHRTW